MLNRHGVFTGGYLNGHGSGKAPASILGRKNQIAELQSATAALQENVAEISRRKGELLSEQTQLQAGLQQAQTELRTQEVAIATRQGEFNALQNSSRVLQQKIETVVYEVNSLAAQEAEGARKRQALAAQAADLETREREWQGSVTALTASQETLRQQRDAANASLTETKVALATQDQLCASFTSQKRPLEQRIAELTHLAGQRRAEIQSFLQRKLQAETEIAESRQKIEGLQHEREQVNVQVAERMAFKEAKEEQISAADAGLARATPGLDRISGTTRLRRGGHRAEEHGPAKPARPHPREISSRSRHRPQRVHHHHRCRRRARPRSTP